MTFVAAWAQQQNVYQIDEQATAQTPWKPGEILKDIVVSVPQGQGYAQYLDVYRKFLGVTPNGHYLVQELYKDGDAKYTDPYLVLEKNAVTSAGLFKATQGTLQGWYPSGKKLFTGNVVQGKWHGVVIIWYETGEKSSESYQENGIMTRYTEWYINGQKKVEAHYEEGKKPRVVQWDEKGVPVN